MVRVVRGLEPYSVQQFWEHLYRPDLVEQLLKGDPERRYKDAAFKLNLEKILDSGPAPQIVLPEKKTERARDTVRITVRIDDTGGGIGGKVVWRVNGKTRGTEQSKRASSTKPSSGYRLVTETLRIDPRRTNVIEVIGHNAAGLLATEPFRITVDPFGGVSDAPRPRMFGIAVGVSERETAIDRLSLATGQSIITAARQAAYEGYQGHGVLTYAILDALTEKAGGKGHEVDIYQLAAQVDRTVPEISHSLFGVYQRPHNKIEGNFPIGVTLAALTPPDSEPDIPAQRRML
jgi:hypothetical protein